jgi:hypothetical protein
MSKNKEKYNWWTDPQNAEIVKQISWWDQPENKTSIELPVSILEKENNFIISGNDETKKLIGKGLCSVASGDTKEEAIRLFFRLMEVSYDFQKESAMKYRKWVPFRKGNWNRIGGTWFVIYGIHVYFRYGKNMKGGWYIPFTKLNISISNEWVK